MATGLLGKANLSSSVNTLIYTVPANKIATANIRVANRNAIDAKIRVAIGTDNAPADEDYIDYDITVPANGILEDTGIVCNAGEKIWVYSNRSSVSVRMYGFEETV